MKVWKFCFVILLCLGILVGFFHLYRVISVGATSPVFLHQFAKNTVEYNVGKKLQYLKGVYDGVSNKTFLVYSSGLNGQYSAVNPYVIEYNHTTHTWGPEIKVDDTYEWHHDSHNYPQIMMDKNGYLHIISFGHVYPPVHLVSQNPRDVSAWNKTLIDTPESNKATYPAAYQAANGDMYVMYRQALSEFTPWHEPEYMMKSTDNGNTWTFQRILDPVFNIADGSGTSYVKGILYQENPEGLHITVGFHKGHDQTHNKHWYVFYRFSDNHLVSASGRDFGTTADRNELEACPECLIVDYGRDKSYELGSQSMSVFADETGTPTVFYVDYTTPYHGILYSKKWTNGAWEERSYPELGQVVGARNFERFPSGPADAYIRVWEGDLAPMYQYSYDGYTFTRIQKINDLTAEVHFIDHYHPEIKMQVGEDYYNSWINPLPVGKRFVAGESNFDTSVTCPANERYINYAWSGNPYFVYPKTAPCDLYSIGSRNDATANMISPQLVSVEPNTTYTLAYDVKTEDVTGTSQWTSVVLAPEYTSQAQPGQPQEQNRITDGRHATVEPTTGTTDWVRKSYTFTTTADTAFVRYQLRLDGWDGVSRGRAYFKNVEITENIVPPSPSPSPSPIPSTSPSLTPTPAPTPFPSAGDINDDGVVDYKDISQLIEAFGTSDATSDITQDGVVDVFDYNGVMEEILSYD